MTRDILRFMRTSQIVYKTLNGDKVFWTKLADARHVVSEESLANLKLKLHRSEFSRTIHKLIDPNDHFNVGMIPGYRDVNGHTEEELGLTMYEYSSITESAYIAKLADLLDDVMLLYIFSHGDAAIDVFRVRIDKIRKNAVEGDIIDAGNDTFSQIRRYYYIFTDNKGQKYVRNMKTENPRWNVNIHFLPPEAMNLLESMKKERGVMGSTLVNSMYNNKLTVGLFSMATNEGKYMVNGRTFTPKGY